MRIFNLIIFILIYQLTSSQGFKDASTFEFYAVDSVKVTADSYFIYGVKPTVLLCHQAGYSRGEYLNTAKQLNALGFSCLAIDQRSGNEVNGIKNLTAQDALSKNINVGYGGAKKDLEAAIDYLYNLNGNQPIILVGSSYSASLALWLANENKKIKAVAAFSPGEYLTGINLADTIKQIQIPIFVSSSQREIPTVEKLLRFVDKKHISHFKPAQKGIHGSRALWSSTKGHENVWKAFQKFMLDNK